MASRMSGGFSDDSDLDSDYDDGVISEDSDIDPALTGGKSSLARRSKLPPANFSDDNFPDPVIFSDDDDEDSNVDDDLDDDFDLRDSLKTAAFMKTKNKKKNPRTLGKRKLMNDKDMDPEKRLYMSAANEAFVRGDLETAWRNYLEVIKLDNRNFGAYKTLGEICQMQGKMNKCCNYWLMAALSSPQDGEFWGVVADLSAQLGHIDQAIHCYRRAISCKDNPNLYAHLFERSMLYKQKKQYGRALEGLQRLNRAFPEDISIYKYLVEVYVDQRRINDAISQYDGILAYNMEKEEKEELGQWEEIKKMPVKPPFKWTELNILIELYINQHAWALGVKVLKEVARWMHGRKLETWWDEHQDDDAEFDSRRLAILREKAPNNYETLKMKPHGLPIDIRFKLGQLRLELDHKDEALGHFRFLFLEKDKEDVSDLMYAAGCHLEEHGLYEEAIDFFNGVVVTEEAPDLNFLLGKCYLEVGDHESARDTLLAALAEDPENVDIKLVLIEALYHTNDLDAAKQLMDEISTMKQVPSNRETDKEEQPDETQVDDSMALIKNSSILSKNEPLKGKPSDEERKEIESRATKLVTDKFNQMQRLQGAIDLGHQIAANAWMKIASQLIEMFMDIKAFFPRNKKTTFKGIVRYRRRKQNFSEKLFRLYNIVERMNDNHNTRTELTSQTLFRGLTYDEWLFVFVQHALMLRQFSQKIDEAIQLLDVAFDVNVFTQHKTRAMVLRLTRLSLAMDQGDYLGQVSNNIRYLLSSTQFSPTIYNVFMCCFHSGVGAWAAFSNYNHQKYFLRQVKTYDSLLTSTKVSGMSQVVVDVKGMQFKRELPQLLYIYACLLGSNRTYSSPIVYLTRAYREYNQDPTICFMLGLAHVHRSLQRNSNNRHIQLLQGISYMLEYKNTRSRDCSVYELQEIEYNFGRLFHMIGLPTLAINHYEKVLAYHDEIEDKDYDFSMEAAYNLTLIYNINGNSALAVELMEKYLTI